MQDKVALITGGGKGIGYGISKAFANEGANLVITGRTESTLLKAKEELEKNYGIKVLAITGDGGNLEDVERIIAATIQEYGRLDASHQQCASF